MDIFRHFVRLRQDRFRDISIKFYEKQKNLAENMDIARGAYDRRHAGFHPASFNCRPTMTWHDFLKSKMVTWLLLVLFLFVLTITIKSYTQKYQIDKEIAKLEGEAEKVKRENDQLASLIEYLKTPDYQEKAAREKLNLKKDGEYVVVLPPNASDADSTQTGVKSQSNASQWFNYFFQAK